jgi:RNA polymerase sigma factor (TIGR02999 family)
MDEPVLQPSPNLVTELLGKWRAGDQEALGALVPLVYNELREVAHRYLRHERPDHTLQSTALVHEAYLRLREQGAQKFENRAHFFAIAAQLMRQILVDYARHRNAGKRNAGRRIALDDTVQLLEAKSVDLVALDDALDELAKLDPRQSRVVELRFFGGLSVEETSSVLGVSPDTVKRDWATAKIWLYHEMTKIP